MALFQKSVLQKYLKSIDEKAVNSAWQKFTEYFHNSEIQKNIRKSKEEQFQRGFLEELFVKVLGYTLNPKPGFNLTTEFKNVKGSKKADGAILKDEKAIAVIELKGTKTIDLDKVENQAFGYKSNQPDAIYVITSNFEKLRFYIDNAVEHLEFNLFQLTQEQFKVLWLCLAKESIYNNTPKSVKDASLVQEENITKQLYKDYSTFKYAIFNSIVELNPKYDKLELFKKTQKLLDRFLFVFFAEDRGLLPPNSMPRIIERWKQLEELDNYKPLYSIVKQYFEYFNKGRKGKKSIDDIFAYNGGLFRKDSILDRIKIDDKILLEHTLKLSAYDFESEIDVNILGHIFEHSLNEIEEMTAKLEGRAIDKGSTKRKKDGVFYTPKYITKYIVDNTVGKLCEEKKVELDIDESDYQKDRKGRKKATLKRLRDKLETYRNWLLGLTICDPACGSGAFLNQTLVFLTEEHQYIDELQAQLLGGSFVFPNVENTILEKNLYGVDINEESIEIAKLALWLRTARKGRKLTSLSNNIKCGNSLIDDPNIAGDKVFDWEKEFPKVFKNGGFDVVIGNPPYGASLDNKDWLKKKYNRTSFGNIDSYKYFFELGANLTKTSGLLGYITPDSYLEKEYFKDLRIFLTTQFGNIMNIKLGDDIFDEVNLPTAISLCSAKGMKTKNYYFKDISNLKSKNDKQTKLNIPYNEKSEIIDFGNSFVITTSIISKSNCFELIEKYDQVFGVKVYQKGKGKPKQTQYERDNNVFIGESKSKDFNYPFISQGIYRYFYNPPQEEYINYGVWLAEPRKEIYFSSPKIVIREIVNPTVFGVYIDYPAVVKNIAAVIIQKEKDYSLKYLLGLINSKLFNYYIDESSPKSGNKSYPSFNSRLIKSLPIKYADINKRKNIENKVDEILILINQNLQKANRLIRRLKSDLHLEKTSKKIEAFYEYDFKTLVGELKKKKIKLSLTQQDEWEEYFQAYKTEINQLQAQIDQTDREIDQMVYELYGLTEDEIAIVENSIK